MIFDIFTDIPSYERTYNLALFATLPYGIGTFLANFTIVIGCKVKSISSTTDSSEYQYYLGDEALLMTF